MLKTIAWGIVGAISLASCATSQSVDQSFYPLIWQPKQHHFQGEQGIGLSPEIEVNPVVQQNMPSVNGWFFHLQMVSHLHPNQLDDLVIPAAASCSSRPVVTWPPEILLNQPIPVVEDKLDDVMWYSYQQPWRPQWASESYPNYAWVDLRVDEIPNCLPSSHVCAQKFVGVLTVYHPQTMEKWITFRQEKSTSGWLSQTIVAPLLSSWCQWQKHLVDTPKHVKTDMKLNAATRSQL